MLEGTELLADVTEALHAAERVGYPVMLKSTAGGGGIGMRVCYTPEELNDAFDAVVRLGKNNFSDAGVFIEKYIERARHLEVQLFGDGRGEVISLGVRDCSIQRRNQKVLEETLRRICLKAWKMPCVRRQSGWVKRSTIVARAPSSLSTTVILNGFISWR